MNEQKPEEKKPSADISKMVAPELPKTKMVKIKALRDCQIDRDTMLVVGEIAEVPEKLAHDFCLPIESYLGQGGEWSEDSALRDRPVIRRAMLV